MTPAPPRTPPRARGRANARGAGGKREPERNANCRARAARRVSRHMMCDAAVRCDADGHEVADVKVAATAGVPE